jgi:hypothetical protein
VSGCSERDIEQSGEYLDHLSDCQLLKHSSAYIMQFVCSEASTVRENTVLL